MDLEFVKKGFDFGRRRKNWVFLLAASSFTTYGVYKLYHLPSVTQKRRRILKLLGALVSVAESVSDSADTIGVISKDLKEFLRSDSDQIPISLRQISKITRSDEFSESLIRVTQAMTVGVLRGYQSQSIGIDGGSNNSNFTDQAMDKLFSVNGSGFASAVVGSFARNLVMGFFSEGQSDSENSSNMNHFDPEMNQVPKWVDVVCGKNCRELIGDCIQLFVSTLVTVYLEKTMDVNPYNEIFSGLTNPKHETKLRDMLVSICNGTVETLVKTSHQVLTGSSLSEKSSLNVHPSSYLVIEESTSPNPIDEENESGWVDKVSSTLAVPSNRRFVLDVTGRVTFETVRSFLEFLLEKIYNGARRCVNRVVEGGHEIVRYVAFKSNVIATICLSLCLHVVSGGWILAPALTY